VALNDDTLIVSVCKVAGLLPVSSEMQSDAAVNITGWVSGALADSISRDLDLGLLRGTGRPQPNGIIDQADEVTGASLIAAAGAAIAEIGEAGGTADTVALSPTAYSAELTRSDDLGHLVHPDGLPDLIGLNIVQVPGLTPSLVYDSSRVFFVLGQDSTVTVHDDPHHDALLLLVKARANVGVPVKAQAIRKLEIDGDGTRAAAPRPKDK
jgi:HK97 family phage major capsid protein